jgi:hypothetical protein
MREHRQRYEKWEDDYIREHYATDNFRIIAEHLGRTTRGVRNRAARIGCDRAFANHRFTKEDDEYILANTGKPLRAVAEHIGANYSEVGKRARKLGIQSWKRPNGELLLDNRGYAVKSFRHKSKPVHEHRIVAERMLGRSLTESERVHHIDGDKATHSEHHLAHSSLLQLGITDATELPQLLLLGKIIFDRNEGIYKCGNQTL